MNPIVRSIDIGFGGTKFTSEIDARNRIHCDSFASLTVCGNQASVDAPTSDVINTVIDGRQYTSGKHAKHLLQGVAFGRIQTPEYPMTPEYLALTNAALYYIGQESLDLLVLGLPVSTYERQRQALEQRMLGRHSFTRVADGSRQQQLHCHVKNVMVLRQPMGALYDIYTNPQFKDRVAEGKILILDPGFYTLDWIVAENRRPIESRCGATNDGGVSSVYKAIRTQLARDTGVTVDINRIDEAYIRGGILKLSGQAIDMKRYQDVSFNILKEALNQMESQIGGFSDIEHIAVVGGSADLYQNVLQERVPHYDIIVPPEPMYSPVRGYQAAGEVWAAKNLYQAA